MFSYDSSKKAEYKFRLVASLVILALLIVAIPRHGLSGPAFFEIGVFGGGFAGVTFAHSFWAIRQIAKQEKGDPTT